MGILDAPALSRQQADSRYARLALGPLYGAFAKIGSAQYQRANIIVAGDSLGEGQSATAISRRWVDIAQSQLRARYATGTQGPGYMPAQYASTKPAGVAFTQPWTYGGGTAPNTGAGLGYKSKQLTSTVTTATTTQTCTSFRLFFRRNAADVVTITIDGGAPATFTMNTNIADQAWDSPALTSGSHTIVITRTAGAPSFNGGYFYNGDETAGLAVWDASHTGGRMVDLAVNNSTWVDQLPFVNASLLVLSSVTNDCRASSGGYSAATFKGHAQTVVTNARAKVANLPILFMPPYKPLGALIEPWANYIGAMQEIVAATPYTALYDMSLTIPDLTSDPYGFLQDTVHPNDLGYAFLGQLATTALSPS